MWHLGNPISFFDYYFFYFLIICSVCHANNNNLFNPTTTPSRPPAPLFSASGEDFITVLVQLDQNDHRRSFQVENDFVYELQSRESPSSGIEPEADFIWTKTQQMSAPASNSWMTFTVTVKELKSSTGYQYVLLYLTSFYLFQKYINRV